MDTYEVAQHTIEYGGGTFTHALGRIEQFRTEGQEEFVWAVGFKPPNGTNTVTRLDTVAFHPDMVITGAIWDFIRLHHDGRHPFGTWIDDGKLYIDHVIITDKESALDYARENGEIAIYNLVTKETVTI